MWRTTCFTASTTTTGARPSSGEPGRRVTAAAAAAAQGGDCSGGGSKGRYWPPVPFHQTATCSAPRRTELLRPCSAPPCMASSRVWARFQARALVSHATPAVPYTHPATCALPSPVCPFAGTASPPGLPPSLRRCSKRSWLTRWRRRCEQPACPGGLPTLNQCRWPYLWTLLPNVLDLDVPLSSAAVRSLTCSSGCFQRCRVACCACSLTLRTLPGEPLRVRLPLPPCSPTSCSSCCPCCLPVCCARTACPSTPPPRPPGSLL